MLTIIKRFTKLIFVSMLVVSISVLALWRRGQYNFTYYDRYLPGMPVPSDLQCYEVSQFAPGYGIDPITSCQIPASEFCGRGYITARDHIITYTRLTLCRFPAGWLVQKYGRPNAVRQYRRITTLTWNSLSAFVLGVGRYDPLDTVYNVGWWKPPEGVR